MKRTSQRILVIWDNIIGSELNANYRIRQLAELARRGHSVTWVSAATSKVGTNLGVSTFKLRTLVLHKVVPILSFLLFQLFAVRCLIASLARSDVIILEVRTVPVLFPFLMIRRLGSSSPALLLRVSTNVIGEPNRLRTLSHRLFEILSIRLSAKFFDMTFFISPMMGQSYSDRYGIPRSKIAVWPSAVDTSVFRETSRANIDRLRKQFGFAPNCLVALHHGVLAKGRGVMEMVRAFKILRDESVKIRLVVLGEGPASGEIARYIETNNLQEVVQLRGPVGYSEVPDHIAACDVGIVSLPDDARWRDQCPLKLLEYLSLNKPVIVSNIPCNRWIVGTAPIGVYLDGTSPREIADGVRAFMRSKNTLDPTLGRQIVAGFSVERIADMLERQISTIISR